MAPYEITEALIGITGLGPRALSRAMGRKEPYIGGILRRKSCPRVDTMAEIATVCGYTIQLVPDDPDRPTLVIDPPTRSERVEE